MISVLCSSVVWKPCQANPSMCFPRCRSNSSASTSLPGDTASTSRSFFTLKLIVAKKELALQQRSSLCNTWVEMKGFTDTSGFLSRGLGIGFEF
ncbi:hypothetical protein PBY51_013881 [Eleginops maclovinus]|uniref:Uncharacterized protein n=1 Tax=Eleginops maclovinus TaxID=56733 RepID=A0AAN8AB70_ELEMC|nr:hypothetical protein PBY51_013881 [Eleginops maclovinus]